MSHLLEFYKEWKAWVDAGAPDGKFYLRSDSLCFAAAHYENAHGLKRQGIRSLLRRDLRRDFNGNDFMPFNGQHIGQIGYTIECRDHKCHLNTMRVAWVEKMIAELEPRMHVDKKTRKALLNFLQDWKVWSNGGGVDNAIKVEAEYGGLCVAAGAYDAGNMIAKTGTPVLYHVLKGYLRRDFPLEMGTTVLPFNEDLGAYSREVQTNACMRNEKRRAWVDKMIEELSREELPADS